MACPGPRREPGRCLRMGCRRAQGSAGVLFVPALSGATAPRWNDEMRGGFSGLSMNHGREHLARGHRGLRIRAARHYRPAGGDRTGRRGNPCRRRWLPKRALAASEGGYHRPADEADRRQRADRARRGDAGRGVRRQLRRRRRGGGQMAALSARCYEPDPRTTSIYDEAYMRYRRLFDALEEVTR